jgi:hypothetical protein
MALIGRQAPPASSTLTLAVRPLVITPRPARGRPPLASLDRS